MTLKITQHKTKDNLLYAFFWVIHRPGNYPEESIQYSEHDESLKSKKTASFN